MDHMTKNTLFCEAQHGFVPGHSCMTLLLIALELWTEILDRGVSLDCIYLDFKKAFDCSPRKTTLKTGRLWNRRATQGVDQRFLTR